MLRRLLDKICKREEASPEEATGDRGLDAAARQVGTPGEPVGKTPEAPEDLSRAGEALDEDAITDGDTIKQRVIENLKKVYDPEIPVNIYEMGLIYEVRSDEEGVVYVKMTLTTPNCPVAGILPGQVESQVRAAEGVRDVQLDLVFDPPWTPERMSEAARLELGML